MKTIGYTLAGIAAGWLLLLLFYSAVRTRWPSNYASSTNDYGMIVNRTIVHYILFSVGPVYVVSLIVSTTVDRAEGSGLLCGVLIGITHCAYRYAPDLWQTIRYARSHKRRPTILLDSAIMAADVAAGLLGGLGPPPGLSIVVPPPSEFFKSLWGTAFVAVLAAVVIARTRVTPDIGRLFARSKREVGSELRRLVREEACRWYADPNLAEAILLTENLQRPPWFRRLERLKGQILPGGTYGVMQVASSKPVPDDESIRIAMRQHLAGSILEREPGSYPDDDQLRALVNEYNPSEEFFDVTRAMYYQLISPILRSEFDARRAAERDRNSRDNRPKNVQLVDVPDLDDIERLRLVLFAYHLCSRTLVVIGSCETESIMALRDDLIRFLDVNGYDTAVPSQLRPSDDEGEPVDTSE